MFIPYNIVVKRTYRFGAEIINFFKRLTLNFLLSLNLSLFLCLFVPYTPCDLEGPAYRTMKRRSVAQHTNVKDGSQYFIVKILSARI